MQIFKRIAALHSSPDHLGPAQGRKRSHPVRPNRKRRHIIERLVGLGDQLLLLLSLQVSQEVKREMDCLRSHRFQVERSQRVERTPQICLDLGGKVDCEKTALAQRRKAPMASTWAAISVGVQP